MATQYYTASSLDGFIATEDHSLEWLLQLGDIEDTGYADFIREVGAVAMGSSTYEWVLRHAVKPGTDEEGEWPYTQPAWVFSSRELPRVPGADIRFVSGDVRPVHAEMESQKVAENIWLIGGGDLVGQFYDAGLLDELIITIGSVTLGAGKPLLPREIAFPPLQLTAVKQLGPGFVELRYDVPQ